MHGLDEPFSVRIVFEKLYHACHSSDKLVNSNAADLVENKLYACSLQAEVVKDSVILHGLQSLDHPSIMDHLNLMNSCVQKYTWAKVRLFLESERVALFSLCEDRPSKEIPCCLIRVSLDVSKFFELPCRKFLYPYKFDHLKASVKAFVGIFCIGLKASFTEEGYSTFFSISQEMVATGKDLTSA